MKAIFVVSAILLISTAAQAECGSGAYTDGQSRAVALAAENNGKLWREMPAGIRMFESGCFLLDGSDRQRRLNFWINNTAGDAKRSHVGVQVIKLRRLPVTSSANSSNVSAYRNTAEWYRGTRKINGYPYHANVASSIGAWNDANDQGDVLPQSDVALGGAWHASASRTSPSSWDNRAWWRIDPAIAARYTVSVENLLIAFDEAGPSAIGSGIPFNFNAGDSDGFIIRYTSPSRDQNNILRFCFDACDDILAMNVETRASRIYLSWLWR